VPGFDEAFSHRVEGSVKRGLDGILIVEPPTFPLVDCVHGISGSSGRGIGDKARWGVSGIELRGYPANSETHVAGHSQGKQRTTASNEVPTGTPPLSQGEDKREVVREHKVLLTEIANCPRGMSGPQKKGLGLEGQYVLLATPSALGHKLPIRNSHRSGNLREGRGIRRPLFAVVLLVNPSQAFAHCIEVQVSSRGQCGGAGGD